MEETLAARARLTELIRRAENSYVNGKFYKAGRGYERAYDAATRLGESRSARDLALLGSLSYERAKPNVAIATLLGSMPSSFGYYDAYGALPLFDKKTIEMEAHADMLRKALKLALVAGDNKRRHRLTMQIKNITEEVSLRQTARKEA